MFTFEEFFSYDTFAQLIEDDKRTRCRILAKILDEAAIPELKKNPWESPNRSTAVFALEAALSRLGHELRSWDTRPDIEVLGYTSREGRSEGLMISLDLEEGATVIWKLDDGTHIK